MNRGMTIKTNKMFCVYREDKCKLANKAYIYGVFDFVCLIDSFVAKRSGHSNGHARTLSFL